jgi:hypothetical protein
MFISLSIRSIVRFACFTQCLLLFVLGAHVGNVFGGCGDYLHHKGSLHFSTSNGTLGFSDSEANLPPELLGAIKVDGSPVSKCSGGNCRSAPDQPPVDPSRTVVLRRQPVGLQINTLDLDLAITSAFAWLNDRLPLSVSLEVMTPPPIISA